MVTRGNVAIYCYNALTAKMWDVEESTNGDLTSKRSEETILAKYFSDFTNEKGEMKLVEEAYVEVSGANTTAIGKNQIKLVAEVENKAGNLVDIATFIDAEKAPKKGEEEVTYKKGDDVVAYVPAEVANTANLAGKKVDVIFGEDNEVAYLVVTDDALEGSYVTALDGDEIELDGEEYELASNVVVTVFGHKLNTTWDADAEEYTDGVAKIAALFGKITVEDADRTADVVYCLDDEDFTRSIIADVTLNGDDEIATINFKFSVDGFEKTIDSKKLEINEFIVEKISAKNVLTVSTNVSEKDDLDDYEDAEPRVIKNGEVAEVADIAVGDVVTEVVYNDTVELLIVVSNTIEGTLEDLYDNTYEIDGNEYKVVATPYYNDEGEVDDLKASNVNALYDSYFEDEVVTAYVNFAGEVVALIAEPEATGSILGVVMDVDDDEYDDENEVSYAKVKILAEDGTNRNYYIYENKKKNKDLDVCPVSEKQVIIFEANADREILAEDITIVEASDDADDTYTVGSNEGLYVEVKDDQDAVDVSVDPKKLGDYRFSSSTIVINPIEKDILSWDALINRAEDPEEFVKTGIFTVEGLEKLPDGATASDYEEIDGLFYKKADLIDASKYTDENVYVISSNGTKVEYVIAWIEEFNYGVSDTQYGVIVGFDKEYDEDEEKYYTATILVDGKEVTYECDSSFRNKVGSFISFDVSDGEIDTYVEMVELSLIDYIDELTTDEVDENVVNHTTLLADETALDAITVKEVDTVDGESYIVFEAASKLFIKSEDTSTVDLADDYIVYSLEDSEVIDTINEGDYVLVIDADEVEEGFEIVIVL